METFLVNMHGVFGPQLRGIDNRLSPPVAALPSSTASLQPAGRRRHATPARATQEIARLRALNAGLMRRLSMSSGSARGGAAEGSAPLAAAVTLTPQPLGIGAAVGSSAACSHDISALRTAAAAEAESLQASAERSSCTEEDAAFLAISRSRQTRGLFAGAAPRMASLLLSSFDRGGGGGAPFGAPSRAQSFGAISPARARAAMRGAAVLTGRRELAQPMLAAVSTKPLSAEQLPQQPAALQPYALPSRPSSWLDVSPPNPGMRSGSSAMAVIAESRATPLSLPILVAATSFASSRFDDELSNSSAAADRSPPPSLPSLPRGEGAHRTPVSACTERDGDALPLDTTALVTSLADELESQRALVALLLGRLAKHEGERGRAGEGEEESLPGPRLSLSNSRSSAGEECSRQCDGAAVASEDGSGALSSLHRAADEARGAPQARAPQLLQLRALSDGAAVEQRGATATSLLCAAAAARADLAAAERASPPRSAPALAASSSDSLEESLRVASPSPVAAAAAEASGRHAPDLSCEEAREAAFDERALLSGSSDADADLRAAIRAATGLTLVASPFTSALLSARSDAAPALLSDDAAELREQSAAAASLLGGGGRAAASDSTHAGAGGFASESGALPRGGAPLDSEGEAADAPPESAAPASAASPLARDLRAAESEERFAWKGVGDADASCPHSSSPLASAAIAAEQPRQPQLSPPLDEGSLAPPLSVALVARLSARVGALGAQHAALLHMVEDWQATVSREAARQQRQLLALQAQVAASGGAASILIAQAPAAL